MLNQIQILNEPLLLEAILKNFRPILERDCDHHVCTLLGQQARGDCLNNLAFEQALKQTTEKEQLGEI